MRGGRDDSSGSLDCWGEVSRTKLREELEGKLETLIVRETSDDNLVRLFVGQDTPLLHHLHDIKQRSLFNRP